MLDEAAVQEILEDERPVMRRVFIVDELARRFDDLVLLRHDEEGKRVPVLVLAKCNLVQGSMQSSIAPGLHQMSKILNSYHNFGAVIPHHIVLESIREFPNGHTIFS